MDNNFDEKKPKSTESGLGKESSDQDSLLQEFGEFSQPSEFGQENFGGNQTNAVTELFDDSFSQDGQERKKKIIMGSVAGVVLALSIAYMVMSLRSPLDEGQFEVSQNSSVSKELPASDDVLNEDSEDVPEIDPIAQGNPNQTTTDSSPRPQTKEKSVRESPVRQAPSGSTETYQLDLTNRGATLTVPAGSRVTVALDSNFSGVLFSTYSHTGEVRIPSPPFGNLYWKTNRDSDVKILKVVPPPSLGLAIKGMEGRSLRWSSTGQVGYFRVLIAQDSGFRQILSQTSTIHPETSFPSLSSGSYYVKIEGLNLASGRWESAQSSITIQ
jgi:hypothetical protein